jgi:hypothetical protein
LNGHLGGGAGRTYGRITSPDANYRRGAANHSGLIGSMQSPPRFFTLWAYEHQAAVDRNGYRKAVMIEAFSNYEKARPERPLRTKASQREKPDYTGSPIKVCFE